MDRGPDEISDLNESELWRLHDAPSLDQGPGSLLDVKIELARRLASPCRLCPRLCGADRSRSTEGPEPYCRVRAPSRIELEGIFVAEEGFICPTYEVFLAGCNMRCVFCYEEEANRRPEERPVLSPVDLVERVQRAGEARTLHFVGGEPSVHLPAALEVIRAAGGVLPVVWNTNLYLSDQALELLLGAVDVVLGDVHFGPGDCDRRLGDTPAAWGLVWNRFRAFRRSGVTTVLRHLLLPGHRDCCLRPILEEAARLEPGVFLHLLTNYTPPFGRDLPEKLGSRPGPEEIAAARRLARELGLVLGFQQHD